MKLFHLFLTLRESSISIANNVDIAFMTAEDKVHSNFREETYLFR
jgi:hypothetical protein